MTFERRVGLEDAIGRGVVGVFVDGVGADLLAGGGKSQVDDAHAGDEDLAQDLVSVSLDLCGQAVVQPPSMAMIAPLMNSASREQR